MKKKVKKALVKTKPEAHVLSLSYTNTNQVQKLGTDFLFFFSNKCDVMNSGVRGINRNIRTKVIGKINSKHSLNVEYCCCCYCVC